MSPQNSIRLLLCILAADVHGILGWLQRRGLSLNPITSLYYIAPASLAFLSIPWFFIEASPLMSDPTVGAPLLCLAR